MVLEEAPRGPSPHEDDHVRLSGRSPGIPSLVDRERPQQAWPLLHESRAEDGCLRRLRQCTFGTRDDLALAEVVRWQDEPESEDHADTGLQPACTFYQIALRRGNAD